MLAEKIKHQDLKMQYLVAKKLAIPRGQAYPQYL